MAGAVAARGTVLQAAANAVTMQYRSSGVAAAAARSRCTTEPALATTGAVRTLRCIGCCFCARTRDELLQPDPLLHAHAAVQ